MNAKQLTVDAMLAAMCAVLGYLALDMGNIKITFESLPILVGALLFGPVDGMLIGGIGTFIYQLLRYGVSATTLLWILPYVVCGAIMGLGARMGKFSLSGRKIVVLAVISELAVTILNTFALYVDSHIYGYYTPAFILGALGIRFVICVVKAIAFGLILPKLTRIIQRTLRLPNKGGAR